MNVNHSYRLFPTTGVADMGHKNSYPLAEGARGGQKHPSNSSGRTGRPRPQDEFGSGRLVPARLVRLDEKGCKVNELPCHHNLETFLDEWLTASGLTKEYGAQLFPTMSHGALVDRTHLAQSQVYRMIHRRALSAGIATKISCHIFRATGITTYLQNTGKLKVAQQMAGHESARTTGLYDRRNDAVALDEIETNSVLRLKVEDLKKVVVKPAQHTLPEFLLIHWLRSRTADWRKEAERGSLCSRVRKWHPGDIPHHAFP